MSSTEANRRTALMLGNVIVNLSKHDESRVRTAAIMLRAALIHADDGNMPLAAADLRNAAAFLSEYANAVTLASR